MTKRKSVAQVLIGLLLVVALVLIPMACKAPEVPPVAPPAAPPEEVTPPAAPPEEVAPPEEAAPAVEVGKFTLADVPEIKNRTPLHIGICSSGGEALVLEEVIKWSEHTGIPVTHEFMLMTVVYPKINLELISASGAYDIVPADGMGDEWFPYLYSLQELAEMYDPGGVAAIERELADFDPTMLAMTSDKEGGVYGMPYYQYQMWQFIRQDVFDDPTEQANFLAKYGYELAPATTYDEIDDQGEFFTRKKGELLKGEPLEWDLYGLALMGGRFEINDEIYSRIWGAGSDFATLVRDEAGNPVEFVITKKDKEVLKWALETEKRQLQWCSPGCLSGFWDFACAQFESGKCIIMPHMYGCLDFWAFNVENVVPGAKLAFHLSPGNGAAFTGTFYEAATRASKNPEAAYWLIKYLGCYECQKRMAEELSFSICRRDVIDDPKYQTPEWWKPCGARFAMASYIWDNIQTPEVVNNYMYCTSSAIGKIYEMQIILCHEAVTGMRTIDDAVAEITKQTIDLQTKFGVLPIREE